MNNLSTSQTLPSCRAMIAGMPKVTVRKNKINKIPEEQIGDGFGRLARYAIAVSVLKHAMCRTQLVAW